MRDELCPRCVEKMEAPFAQSPCFTKGCINYVYKEMPQSPTLIELLEKFDKSPNEGIKKATSEHIAHIKAFLTEAFNSGFEAGQKSAPKLPTNKQE